MVYNDSLPYGFGQITEQDQMRASYEQQTLASYSAITKNTLTQPSAGQLLGSAVTETLAAIIRKTPTYLDQLLSDNDAVKITGAEPVGKVTVNGKSVSYWLDQNGNAYTLNANGTREYLAKKTAAGQTNWTMIALVGGAIAIALLMTFKK